MTFILNYNYFVTNSSYNHFNNIWHISQYCEPKTSSKISEWRQHKNNKLPMHYSPIKIKYKVEVVRIWTYIFTIFVLQWVWVTQKSVNWIPYIHITFTQRELIYFQCLLAVNTQASPSNHLCIWKDLFDSRRDVSFIVYFGLLWTCRPNDARNTSNTNRTNRTALAILCALLISGIPKWKTSADNPFVCVGSWWLCWNCN